MKYLEEAQLSRECDIVAYYKQQPETHPELMIFSNPRSFSPSLCWSPPSWVVKGPLYLCGCHRSFPFCSHLDRCSVWFKYHSCGAKIWLIISLVFFQNGYTFLPFAFGTLGCLSTEAPTLFARLHRKWSSLMYTRNIVAIIYVWCRFGISKVWPSRLC